MLLGKQARHTERVCVCGIERQAERERGRREWEREEANSLEIVANHMHQLLLSIQCVEGKGWLFFYSHCMTSIKLTFKSVGNK